jgi:hypothetical protein
MSHGRTCNVVNAENLTGGRGGGASERDSQDERTNRPGPRELCNTHINEYEQPTSNHGDYLLSLIDTHTS